MKITQLYNIGPESLGDPRLWSEACYVVQFQRRCILCFLLLWYRKVRKKFRDFPTHQLLKSQGIIHCRAGETVYSASGSIPAGDWNRGQRRGSSARCHCAAASSRQNGKRPFSNSGENKGCTDIQNVSTAYCWIVQKFVPPATASLY